MFEKDPEEYWQMPSARDNWIVFDLLNEYRLTGIAFQGFDNQQMPKNWLLESGSERISQSLCFCLLSLSLLSLSLSLPIPLLFFVFFCSSRYRFVPFFLLLLFLSLFFLY